MTSHAAHLTSHLSDEMLSAYLDGELKDAKAERVADHLSACPNCQARVDGLRRVVHSLARLERAAPPPILAQRVERRIALEARDAPLVQRLENRLQGLPLDSPVLTMFAVVLALGVIVYAFSHQVAHHRGDVSLHVTAPEAAEGLMAEIEAVEIDGRELVRRGDEWREEGVGAAGEAQVIAWDSAEGAALRSEHPWVEELLTLTGASAVEFRAGDGVVRLQPAAEPPAEGNGASGPTEPAP